MIYGRLSAVGVRAVIMRPTGHGQEAQERVFGVLQGRTFDDLFIEV